MNEKELTNAELREIAGLPAETMADRVQGKIKNTATDVRYSNMTRLLILQNPIQASSVLVRWCLIFRQVLHSTAVISGRL